MWLILPSCSDILEESPEGQLVVGNFYQTEGDALAAVTAIYNRLYSRMYERDMQLMVDLPTDDYKNGQGMNNAFLLDIEFLRITPENQFVARNWQDHYDGINRANAAINRIPDIIMDEELKTRLIGEATFLRALFYFNLVRFYGDVPLILEDTRELGNLNVARSPEAEVYNQIISDLNNSITSLPETVVGSDAGRATQGAARVLLGKVYLTLGDWPMAVSTLQAVIENEATYGYGLHEDFAANWERGTENEVESVFTVQFMEAPGNGNVLMRSTCPRNRVPGIVGWEADIPTQEVYDIFEEGDERMDRTLFTGYTKDGVDYEFPLPLFFKYFEVGKEGAENNTNSKVHVLRYADALLMYAEAINEVSGPTSQAFEAINRVRRRAYNDNEHDLSGLDQEQFREAVYLERRKELVMECHRWFDLVRTGRFIETMQNHNENGGTQVREHMVKMPIPQRDLDINTELVQNDGYSGNG